MRGLMPLALALFAVGCNAFGSDAERSDTDAGTSGRAFAGMKDGGSDSGARDATADAGADSGVATVEGKFQLPANAGDEEGTSANTSPFGVSAQRFQSVYGEALLTALPRGAIIKAIRFRLDGDATSFVKQTIESVEIRLSTSKNPPGSLSLDFAANRGADSVIVRAGPLAIEPTDYPSGAKPNAFGKRIDFNLASFTYQGGPLLLEMATSAAPTAKLVDNVSPSTLDSQSI